MTVESTMAVHACDPSTLRLGQKSKVSLGCLVIPCLKGTWQWPEGPYVLERGTRKTETSGLHHQHPGPPKAALVSKHYIPAQEKLGFHPTGLCLQDL